MMPLPDPVTFIALLAPVTPLAVFLHELGHAVAGHLAGYVVTSFGLGIGRPWCVVGVRGVRVYAGLVRPLQGVAFAFHPDLFPTRRQSVAFLSGGILANAASAAIGLPLWLWAPWGRDFWFVFFLVGACFAATSLIPVRLRIGHLRLQSDGASILQVLRSGAVAQSAPIVVQALDALRGLWSAIGDVRMLRVHTLAAAMSLAELGDIEPAEHLLGEEESVGGMASPPIDALNAIARALLALGRRRFEEARAAMDEAEAAYRARGRPEALFLVGLLRASGLLLGGEPAAAASLLDGLEAGPVARRNPSLRANLLALRAQVACASDDEEDVASRLARYEGDRRRWRSATLDLAVYEAVAAFRSRRGDVAGAVAAWRVVLEVVAALAGEWSDPARRARFLEVQAARLDRARADFEAAGLSEELDRRLREAAEATPKETWKANDRRLRRWARYAMLGNLAAFVLVIAVGPEPAVVAGRNLLALGAMLAVCGVVWLAYWIIDQTIGRIVPGLRRFGGAVLLMLAVSPWLTTAILLATP